MAKLSAERSSARPKTKRVTKLSPSGAPELTNRQRTVLRGLGHHLNPVVQLGKDGISEGLLAAVATVLEQHELIKIKLLETAPGDQLIKIKLLETAPGDRHELAEQLAKDCRAALVQVIGRNLLLYRPRSLTDPRPSLEMELA